MTRPKTSTRVQLRIARAQVRELRRMGQPNMAIGPLAWPSGDKPAKFIYAWSVYGRPVTQALDSDGQVWESVSDKIDGEWVFRGWKKITMTRDETEPKEKTE